MDIGRVIRAHNQRPFAAEIRLIALFGCLLFICLAAACAGTREVKYLTASEIQESIIGTRLKEVDSDLWKEHFIPGEGEGLTGDIRGSDTGGPYRGRWSISGDSMCIEYPLAPEENGCYRFSKRKGNKILWFDKDGAIDFESELVGSNAAKRRTNQPARPVVGQEAVPDLPEEGQGWAYSNLDLEVTIRPDQGNIKVKGTARLRLDIESSFGPALFINYQTENMSVLDLRSDPPASNTRLDQVIQEGHPSIRIAHLRFDKAFAKGDEVAVRFEYESINQGSQFQVNQTMAFASWTEAWYPVPAFDFQNVAPSKAMTSPGQSRFLMPEGWSAASEGTLIEREETEEGVIETWDIDFPLARSFAAGPFTKGSHDFEGRSINVFQMSAKETSAQDQATILAEALLAMEERLGPFPYPSYSIIEIPEEIEVSWSAASQQGLIFANSAAFNHQGGNLPLFAHEMAHGWWGNLVSSSGGPGSILCDESLAQYGAVIAIETIEGIEARNEFLNFSRDGYSSVQSAHGYFYIWREGFDKPMIELSQGGWNHQLADSKGHWIYHMLRERVGDDVFFGTLRGLIQDYSGKILSLDGMRAAFVAAAPEQSLEVFFEQWLERTGAPILGLDWWSNYEGTAAHIEITQLQEGEPYQLDIELEIEFADGGTITEAISLNETEHTFALDTPSRPINVRLDPNYKLLIWRPEYGPRPPTWMPGPYLVNGRGHR